MQFGIGVGRAGNAWARYGTGRCGDVYRPEAAIPAAARYLCATGAPRRVDGALYAYNPVLGLRRPRQAVGRPLPRGWRPVTLTSHRCLPDGGCSRPHPDRVTLDAAVGLAASGPLAAVDAYGHPSNRPRWLAGEYLALLERQGRGVGVITCCTSTSRSVTPPTHAGTPATTPGGPWTCPPGWLTTRLAVAPA
jgi:hypothetical protein